MAVDLSIQAVETLLLALSRSPYFKDFVVRGSVSSQDWMGEYQRPCNDLDLLYLPDNDLDKVAATFNQIIIDASLIDTKPLGLALTIDAVERQDIWKDSLSPGIRLEIPLAQAAPLQVDIGVGDPLCRAPLEKRFAAKYYAAFPIRTVVLEIAVAWKLHGLFEHINGPWQSKTLWDLYLFCRYNHLDVALLKEAIDIAFLSRLDPIVILKRFLYGDFGQSAQSRKHWKKDLIKLNKKQFIALDEVLQFLQPYFIPILDIPDDRALLTLSKVIDFRVKNLNKRGG